MVIPSAMKLRHARGVLLFVFTLALFEGVFLFRARGDDGDAQKWATEAELSTRKLGKDRHDEKAWANLVRARLKETDWKRAEKAIADWRAAVPHPSPMIERVEAETAVAREDFKGAITAWKNYLGREPDDADGWMDLSLACANDREWKNAVDAATHSLKIKDDAWALTQRARDLIRLHDWNAAGADVRAANKLDPLNKDVQLLLPVFERAKEWVAVVGRMDESIAADPKNVRLRIDRAEWLIGEGLTNAGGDDIEEAFKLDPKSLRVRIWHGILAWDRNEPSKAGNLMKLPIDEVTSKFEVELKEMDASSDAEARARFLIRSKQPVMALDEVRDVDGSVGKAQALFDLSRLPEAGAAARRAVEVHADDPEAWLALARLDMENGNFKETLEALDRSSHLKKTKEADDLRKTTVERLGKK